MIDLALVTKAVGQVITASGAFPRVVWPNRDGLPDRPFLVVELLPGPITDATARQAAPTWTGSVVASVVIDLNQFETPGHALAGQLAALFPSGSRLTLDDGAKLLISGHPRVTPGYRDGADYRIPVSIPLSSD